MTLYIYRTKECSKDASIHNLGSQLENIETQIIETQNLVGFKPFRPTRLIKKSMGRNFRLLAYHAQSKEDSLILLLRIFSRSDSAYDWLCHNHESDSEKTQRRFLNLTEDEIHQIYCQKIEDCKDLEETIPSPSDSERKWLYSVFTNTGVNKNDLLVLESRQWVEEMISPRSRDFLGVYQGFLNQLDISSLEKSSSITDVKYSFNSDGRVGILYVFLPNYNQLFLVCPLRGNQKDRNRKIQEFKDAFSKLGLEAEESQQDLLRFASRSYPFFMILDCDAWLDIQKDTVANLALSPEEGELLESTRSASFEAKNYPLFINGRAGSGKSTILQYLMADFVDFSLKNSDDLYPLYITYSEDLLRSARETARRLLRSHAIRLIEGEISDTDINKVLSSSFVVFKDFLLSLLPEDVRADFPDKNLFVGYGEFQRLWEMPGGFGKRSEARKIDSGLAWHIIRSYIKGIRAGKDDDLSPQEFQALPKKTRSVTYETYKFVYERVWLSWYKPLNEEEGYWDEQDLVAIVLDLGIVNQLGYGAIICDEAQDFTSTELEFIFQLSVFSKRKLNPQELKRVPFVFAADPLQTLNPTGFRWENIQADFHERFCSVLDPGQRSNLDITYKELKFNYRSNRGIVHFCNLIQLLRLCLIGGKNIHPQKGWLIEDDIQVSWFDVSDIKTQEQICKNPEIVKIINCNLGGETEFAKEDLILQKIEGYEENTYPNILSPVRSKGLEFSRVILYRFGESAPDGFEQLLNGEFDIRDETEKCLQYKYFLNSLYVAASRAKNQLIIVDSKEAIDRFWKFATDPTVLNKIANSLKDFNIWQDKVAYLLLGGDEAWTGEPVDNRVQAEEYETQGRNRRDSYLLRQAALSYDILKEPIKSTKCFAEALILDKDYQKAGDFYQKSGLYEEAFDSYWRGKNFNSITQLTTQYSSLSSRIRSRAADFMSQINVVPNALISELLEMFSGIGDMSYFFDDLTWHSVLREISERSQRMLQSRECNWRSVATILETCYAKGISFDENILGQIAHRANRFDLAFSYFEKSGNLESREYYEAKAEYHPLPEKLLWLRKLNEFSKVLEEWRNYPEFETSLNSLEKEIAIAVCDAAVEEQNHNLALLILQTHSDPNRARKVFDSAIRNDKYLIALAIIKKYDDRQRTEKLLQKSLELENDESNISVETAILLLRSLIQDKHWQDALNLINGDYKLSKTESTQLLGEFLRRNTVSRLLSQEAVVIFARSVELSRESLSNKSPISEFLYQRFIAQKPLSSLRNAELSLKTVGAAIERAGKIVNVIRFYESLQQDSGLTSEEVKFAKERLIASVERYVQYLSNNRQFKKVKERELQAKNLRRKTGIGSKQLDEYPKIAEHELLIEQNSTDDVDLNTEVVTQQSIWDSDALSCQCSPNRDKWRVEYKNLFQTVTFSLSDLTMGGDADFSRMAITLNKDVAAWRINEWDTTIRILKKDGNFEILIKCGGVESFRISP